MAGPANPPPPPNPCVYPHSPRAKPTSFFSPWTLPVVLGAPTAAQCPLDNSPGAGIGRQTACVDLGPCNGARSAVFLPLTNRFYVTDGSSVVRTYNPDGTPAGVFSVPAAAGVANHATTDGTHLLFTGSSSTLWVADDQLNLVTTVNAANGPTAISNPIALTLASPSSLAFNPQGDSGAGSVFLGGFEVVAEQTLQSVSIGALNFSTSTAVEGLEVDAADPLQAFLWVHGAPNPDALTEYELSGPVPTPTGREIPIRSNAGTPFGVTTVPGNVLEGRPYGRDLVALNEDFLGSCRLTAYRLHLFDHYLLPQEKALRGLDRSRRRRAADRRPDPGPGERDDARL